MLQAGLDAVEHTIGSSADELEEMLIEADLGPHSAARITARFAEARFGKTADETEIKEALAQAIGEELSSRRGTFDPLQGPKPYVVMFIGVNGSGKTTTLGKIATDLTRQGAKVLVAINTFARAGGEDRWRASAKTAIGAGADAIIAADLAVLAHVRELSPTMRLHLSVQAAANTPEAIRFYVETFGVRRVVVPRVMSAPEIAELIKESSAEVEAFVFGGLCVMTEGRCALSSYVSGQSPNLSGVCSPPEAVSFERTAEGMVSRLSGLALDKTPSGATAGYPTLCKGRFAADGEAAYLFEEPTSLNAMGLLARLGGSSQARAVGCMVRPWRAYGQGEV